MKRPTGISAVLIVSSVLMATSCTPSVARKTVKDHRIVVVPGETLRPGRIERGDGEVEHLESMPAEGETFMLIIRGRI